MDEWIWKIVSLFILFHSYSLITAKHKNLKLTKNELYDEEPVIYSEVTEVTFESLLYPDKNYFDELQLTQSEGDSTVSKFTLQDLDPYISNYLKGIYFPSVNSNGLHFGSSVVGLQSPALHRIIRKYYYFVLNVLLMLPNNKPNNLFYKKFNEQLAKVLLKIVKLKKQDKSNSNLYLLINFFNHHKLLMPTIYELPEENANYAEACTSLVSFLKLPVKPKQFVPVNMGPVNFVNNKAWTENDCPSLFEKSNTNIIPYFDDDGVDIRPPEILGDRVKFRGNHLYNEKELYSNGALLTFYRCVILKVNSVPEHTEKMCYYYEFNRKFLMFLNDYQPKNVHLLKNNKKTKNEYTLT